MAAPREVQIRWKTKLTNKRFQNQSQKMYKFTRKFVCCISINKTAKQMHADVIDTPASFHISKPANFFVSSLL